MGQGLHTYLGSPLESAFKPLLCGIDLKLRAPQPSQHTPFHPPKLFNESLCLRLLERLRQSLNQLVLGSELGITQVAWKPACHGTTQHGNDLACTKEAPGTCGTSSNTCETDSKPHSTHPHSKPQAAAFALSPLLEQHLISRIPLPLARHLKESRQTVGQRHHWGLGRGRGSSRLPNFGKSPRREVVRSSAGAGVVYPPFFGVIRVAYPKA